jgi:hypothetical protein
LHGGTVIRSVIAANIPYLIKVCAQAVLLRFAGDVADGSADASTGIDFMKLPFGRIVSEQIFDLE